MCLKNLYSQVIFSEMFSNAKEVLGLMDIFLYLQGTLGQLYFFAIKIC